jgi:hypothetical protein
VLTGDLSAYVPVKELAAYGSVIIRLGPTN